MTERDRHKIEMLTEDWVQAAENLREYELACKRKRAEFLDFLHSLQDKPPGSAA
jgi:hypothetical protein